MSPLARRRSTEEAHLPEETHIDVAGELVLRSLFAAATELPMELCRELARRVTEFVVIQAQNHAHDLQSLSHGDARFIGAIRSVAEVVGHPPSTSEYVAEHKRRSALGDTGLPSIATILRHFDGWPYALAAAGYLPAVAPSGIQRRRNYGRKVVHRYSRERLAECLRACARDIGRTPMVRDYAVWREELLAGKPGRRRGPTDIPHHRTYYERFRSWDAALLAAALPVGRPARTQTTAYSRV